MADYEELPTSDHPPVVAQESSLEHGEHKPEEGASGEVKKVEKPEEPATAWTKLKKLLESIVESGPWSSFMTLVTIWTLFQTDIKYAGTESEADTGFEVVITIFFFTFWFEIIAQSIYKEGYFVIPSWEPEPGESLYETWIRRLSFGSFYFWMDIVATCSIVLDMEWVIGVQGIVGINGGGSQAASGGQAAKSGSRLGRLIRLVRMVRLTRLAKLYKYAVAFLTGNKVDAEEEDAESRVGAAMSDLTNRRVLCLILLMLIIIPLLNINDPDVSMSLGVQLVHQLAELNATDSATYQSGLLLAIDTVRDKLDVVRIEFNENDYYLNSDLNDRLRPEEKLRYFYNGQNIDTAITFSQRSSTIVSALYSIYTTAFIIVLLVGGIYAFSVDVQNLVITPIEKLVKLVKKIAENPLGVEYKMLGEEDGFKDGMETTVLLTTITKIGGLMRVGFGEAGAAIIAKNLKESTGGKLNLLGSGQTIYSIFGFCDVRQFTDTTECLQEEVMLFVNRIAHILHSIVVQCSGAANKNIGDAFLLSWKISDQATKEQKALIADQALLTFCKALIELSRHQEFICNFSVAATARLFKRFPEYKVRIGSGLHVGWAVEGAIGSNRKIDATYISPHVSATEFLESSTKEYGVSLLLSEPFYRLLSPAAQKYIRQVDRIKRSAEEPPMGLYTYDSDLNIDWNDPFRHRKKSDMKSRLVGAARRATALSNEEKAALKNGNNIMQNLAPINEHSGSFSATSSAQNNRRKSKDAVPHVQPAGRKASVTHGNAHGHGHGHGHPPPADVLEEVDEENAEAAESAAADRMERAKDTPTIVVPPYTERIWVEDQDLVDVRHLISDAFRVIWAEGMDAFIIGDWMKAKDKFTECYRLTKKKDGPSKRLIEYIEQHHDAAPESWQGYVDLSEGGGGH